MKRLTLLLLACAIAVASGARADDPMAGIRAACADDAQKLCAGVARGGGRIVACLKEHKDSLSERCREAAGLPASAADSAASPLPATAGNNGAAASATAVRPGGAAAGSPAASSHSHASRAPAAIGTVKFSERIIADEAHGGMRAATIHLPEKWHFDGKIEWHYNWIEYPVSYSYHAENPDNSEAYFQYPLLRLESVDVIHVQQHQPWRTAAHGRHLPGAATAAAGHGDVHQADPLRCEPFKVGRAAGPAQSCD
jgi:hypothetical protein